MFQGLSNPGWGVGAHACLSVPCPLLPLSQVLDGTREMPDHGSASVQPRTWAGADKGVPWQAQSEERLFAHWAPATPQSFTAPAPQPWQKQGGGALGSTHPGWAFGMEKPRQSKCILKRREGVAEGKERVWRPPKPAHTSHISTYRGRAGASHTGSAGQCWGEDVQRWGWQGPSLLTTPFWVPAAAGDTGTTPASPAFQAKLLLSPWLLQRAQGVKVVPPPCTLSVVQTQGCSVSKHPNR